MKRETEYALLALLGIYVLSKLKGIGDQLDASLAAPLREAGARLYETLHPDEAGHKNDLPENPKPNKGPRMMPSAILAIAQLVGFPDPKLATAIAMAESSGFPKNVNSTPREYSCGLWQINTKVHPYTPEQMFDPLENARAAYAISRGGQDWTPWGAYTSGRYKQFQQGILA